jgi:hypothetical protein
MSVDLTPVTVYDSISDLADWLEIRAIVAPGRMCSAQDLLEELRVAGETGEEAAPEFEEEEEEEEDVEFKDIEHFADEAFALLEERLTWCGGEQGTYPFLIEPGVVSAKDGAENSAYLFLLLLSKFGIQAGPSHSNGSKLFEHLCAAAAVGYFGGNRNRTEALVFGFPRSGASKSFTDAVDELCHRLGEGGGPGDDPRMSEMKDAALDLVVWNKFQDERPGKIIGFGQCATGERWRGKRTELLPDAFDGTWFKKTLPVRPVRLFFVPHIIEEAAWNECCRHAGIVFDRCRIAETATGLDESLHDGYRQWCVRVLSELEP